MELKCDNTLDWRQGFLNLFIKVQMLKLLNIALKKLSTWNDWLRKVFHLHVITLKREILVWHEIYTIKSCNK